MSLSYVLFDEASWNLCARDIVNRQEENGQYGGKENLF